MTINYDLTLSVFGIGLFFCYLLYKANIRSYNKREVTDMKKMTIQEFNQDYMMIDEKEMIFEEEYPSREQFDYITDKVSHEETKKYNIEYSAMIQTIHMGEIGKYRMDGVPFGFNAFIITIEESDNCG